MYKNDGITKRYSEGFKLKILAELSTGNYSKRQLGMIYGINRTTINEWIKKYDRKDLMNTRILVETKDETTRIKALQKEIKQLKELLIKKDLDKLVLDSYLEVTAEKMGYKNVGELKKKLKHLSLVKAVETTRSTEQASIEQTCKCYDMHRDAYYKFKKRIDKRKVVAARVIELVKEERIEQPRVGTRKLYEALQYTFEASDLKVGRDSLFDILREHDMLVKRKKASCKTTDSYHRFHKYKNLVKNMVVSAPNQVWVSDITYIRTVNGFCYLALITDMYSRKIVGYDISDSLELAGCLRALKLALRTARPADGLVHHSDRGIQYCSNQYVEKLKKRNIRISMTEENHCYENAIAERVNGILKDEFYLDQCFFNTKYAIIATKNAIDIYNNKRLHVSLGYKTPNMVFKNVA